MPAWLSWITAALGWLIRALLNRTPVAVAEAEKAGAAAQAPDTADEVAARMEQGTF